MQSRLFIGLFVCDEPIAQSLTELLSGERYRLHPLSSKADFIRFVGENTEQIDCLIVLHDPSVLPLFNQLYEQGILLPAIVIEAESVAGDPLDAPSGMPTCLYHGAEVRLRLAELEQIATTIDQAIAQFLHLGPSCPLVERPISQPPPNPTEQQQSFLLLQQRRLAEKLKERLGYLGVYYKRNPNCFYRNLPSQAKKELIKQLNSDYREIILNYFSQEAQINPAIDQFVNRAFFADLSASQLLELHMELMDEFAQQLKLEGRSEEILLDYRLVLIDILAHLAEMYRRSIPREDIPFELLYRID